MEGTLIVPVILSGGSGTRLWPLSRSAYPKQFIPLIDDSSLFQATLERVSKLPESTDALVICNEEHRFMVAEQARKSDKKCSAIMLEPIGRNTAPAIACGALFALRQDKEAMVMVTPSDHVISDQSAFLGAIERGVEAARNGGLVTFGVVPDKPETGYGYIRREQNGKNSGAYKVEEFVEKPDLETAIQYLESGHYLWNSGMFLFKAQSYLEELTKFQPEIIRAATDAFEKQSVDLDFVRLDKEAFLSCPSESIDYAVMEKTDKSMVVPMSAGWSDIGSWSSLSDAVAKESEDDNVFLGDVLAQDVTNSYLRSESRMIAGIGIDGLVVVETADAVLVADKSKSQDVKDIVARLKASGRYEPFTHVRVYRPWGRYETVDECDRFKVKRIVVNPGASLSLQRHNHRAEHWVIVKGTARIVNGNEEKLLTEDQSTYIPIGTVHRLENPGLIPLEIVEVQTGSYLGEDDIERFSDVYGRDDSKSN
ncbi:MAG: mannose-1-phosphate guanylyltransferase/mannose-6-phosphate isomerase [Candidatus Thiodiazotropha sp.]